MKKCIWPPDEQVNASNKLCTVIESAMAGQAGAIRAKAFNPTVFLSST